MHTHTDTHTRRLLAIYKYTTNNFFIKCEFSSQLQIPGFYRTLYS